MSSHAIYLLDNHLTSDRLRLQYDELDRIEFVMDPDLQRAAQFIRTDGSWPL